jgi:beta-glucosidase
MGTHEQFRGARRENRDNHYDEHSDQYGGSWHRSDSIAGTAADEAREHVVEAALGKLDLAAKAALLAGADMWSIAANPEIGFGRLVMSDGPAGVRGEKWSAEDPSLALPSPTALAATWDVALVREAGRVMAGEARRKGAHVVLAPTVNLHRSPRGGRHFEAYSEDPLLTGEIGTAFVRGVQDGGVGTTPKHWVANDSETDRFTVNVIADERTLRELYMAPFEAIVRKARPWGLMAAYNSVNGPSMTEHDELNTRVLRQEWGFDGMLVSDWTAARDTVRAALGGLDAAMPGPATVYGERLVEAVRAGDVPESVVDEKARRLLRLAARLGLLEGAPAAVPAELLPEPPDGVATLRKIAVRSFTLLGNDGILPLASAGHQPASIALIGIAGKQPRIGGGGSAQVFPEHVVSPLDGLRAALPASTRLVYEVGTDPRTFLPPAAFGCTATIVGRDGSSFGDVQLPDGVVRWIGEMPHKAPPADIAEVVITSTLNPSTAGAHRLAVRGIGPFTLRANGATLFDGEIQAEGMDLAAMFLSPPERVFELDVTDALDAVEVELRHAPTYNAGLSGFGVVSFSLGHGEPTGAPDDLIEAAVRAAAEAEIAIVVVGTTEETESEGVDRDGLALPGRQDELVRRVAAVNPRTVVVVNAGAPVLLPWRDEVAAVLLAWFPGQEAGAALADVLLGREEPGGRLPTTWPARQEDCPVWEVVPTDGRLEYTEGLLIGYRAWERRVAQDAAAALPAYRFGHGQGYTSWEYESVQLKFGDFDTVRHEGEPYATLATSVVRLRNSGARAGREVVQLYLRSDADAEDRERPLRQLAGFAVVEAAPGETVEAEIELPLRAFQRWGADGWELRTGLYELQAAHDSGDVRVSLSLEVPPRG